MIRLHSPSIFAIINLSASSRADERSPKRFRPYLKQTNFSGAARRSGAETFSGFSFEKDPAHPCMGVMEIQPSALSIPGKHAGCNSLTCAAGFNSRGWGQAESCKARHCTSDHPFFVLDGAGGGFAVTLPTIHQSRGS